VYLSEVLQVNNDNNVYDAKIIVIIIIIIIGFTALRGSWASSSKCRERPVSWAFARQFLQPSFLYHVNPS
jgi:hypothetical protein